MDAIRVTDRDAEDPKMLRRHLNVLFEQNMDLLRRVESAEQSLRSGTGTVGGLTEEERRLLRAIATGSPETPVSAQRATIPTVSVKPPVNTSSNGDVIHLSTDNIIYRFDGTTRSWVAIGAATPAGMMTLDTPQIVTSAGVKTVQASWIFQVTQSIVAAIAGQLGLVIENTSSDAAAVGRVLVQSNGGSAALTAYSTASAATLGGITLADWATLITASLAGLAIGSAGAVPVVFVTSNLERGRLDAAGLWTFSVAGKTILIKPPTAPSAGTLMFEVQDNTAASVFSVDIEGDLIGRDVAVRVLTASGDVQSTGGDVISNDRLTGARLGLDNAAIALDGQTTIDHQGTGVDVPILLLQENGSSVFEVEEGGYVFLANKTITPATPTGGGVFFVEGGAYKFKGSAGTVTTIAPA